ncbi:MAG: hypothetical protein B1H12_11250 [Desulfobacteraceae bacterium 4484_190.2]|nr:MAG: hypothetical protein B1H12_11250 [Desulfobacteraceae bacterium 4484_190.2]
MQSDQKKEKKRKSVYEKPRLRKIELAAEEVLGVGCKLAGGGFNVGATPCPINSCVSAGS